MYLVFLEVGPFQASVVDCSQKPVVWTSDHIASALMKGVFAVQLSHFAVWVDSILGTFDSEQEGWESY